jgi:hypothetical protein
MFVVLGSTHFMAQDSSENEKWIKMDFKRSSPEPFILKWIL